jgi:hypothetical protein
VIQHPYINQFQCRRQALGNTLVRLTGLSHSARVIVRFTELQNRSVN